MLTPSLAENSKRDYSCGSPGIIIMFSNTLIIHQVKTKKIITVKEVWIPGLNYHRFLQFYFFVFYFFVMF